MSLGNVFDGRLKDAVVELVPQDSTFGHWSGVPEHFRPERLILFYAVIDGHAKARKHDAD